jgi:hypothetical protein
MLELGRAWDEQIEASMSIEPEIPPAVEALIGHRVRTIEELETLLLLARERRFWDALAVANALKLSEGMAVAALQGLVQAQLVAQVGDASPLPYVFAPLNHSLREATDQLIRYYSENRFELVMLISARAIERLRTGVLQRFADSFQAGTKRHE